MSWNIIVSSYDKLDGHANYIQQPGMQYVFKLKY